MGHSLWPTLHFLNWRATALGSRGKGMILHCSLFLSGRERRNSWVSVSPWVCGKGIREGSQRRKLCHYGQMDGAWWNQLALSFAAKKRKNSEFQFSKQRLLSKKNPVWLFSSSFRLISMLVWGVEAGFQKSVGDPRGQSHSHSWAKLWLKHFFSTFSPPCKSASFYVL